MAHREEEGRLDHDVSAKFLFERDGVFMPECETPRHNATVIVQLIARAL